MHTYCQEPRVTAFLQAAAFVLIACSTSVGNEDIEAARIHERGFVLVAPPIPSTLCTASRSCRTDAAGGGDFNGDGFDDFVAVWVNSNGPDPHEAIAILVYGGDSRKGTYQLEDIVADSVTFSLGEPKRANRVRAAFLGDLNGDGRSELALSFNVSKDPNPTCYIVFGEEGLSGEIPVPTPGLDLPPRRPQTAPRSSSPP